MQLVDIFCGVGGFAAGARECATPILGVDNDDLMVRLWAANTNGNGKLAELWTDDVDIPPRRPQGSEASDVTRSEQQPTHVHISPPCTTLSKARRDNENVAGGLAYLSKSLEFLRRNEHTPWSIETVSTPLVRECLRNFQETHADFKFAWTVVDAADYGSPSTRVRIIAGDIGLIHALRQIPVSRVSVADAFRRAGLETLPADFIKNNTKTRANRPCLRHVSAQCHTQTASHPLVWCTADGATVRCLNVRETAIIMGFPEDWLLPTSTRAAIKAIGNAVPPPLAAAIMSAALSCLDS
jgi:site-specific DNA-cytosine methylase